VSKTALSYLGSYRLLKLVHNGEGSRIWRAYDDGSQKFVGVKTLSEKYKQNRERIGQLKQEYTVGVKLKHPNVLRVHEFGIDRGTPYVAMEWFPAPTMKRRIHLGIERIAHLLPKIILQATEALAYFNEQGWIHRDVKPDNFLIDDDGQVKLIDFSLARRKRGVLGRLLSQRSKAQGTRSYMSPEQIRKWALDERADVYSLGCTLYHLIAGNPPFTGANTNELLKQHLRAPPPRLEAANPNVTPAFSNLIRMTMAKKAAERPKSARSLATQFRGTPLFLVPPKSPSPQEKGES
jgi:serine/threonine protein kinase